MKKLFIFLLFALSVSFTSCSFWYCYVDAIGDTPISKSYYIEPRFPEDVNPLVVKEYLKDLDIVMNQLGYVKTDPDRAELKIAFGYNIGEKSDRAYTSSTPVYMYTPSKTTYGKSNSTISSSDGKKLGSVSTTTSTTSSGTYSYGGQKTTTSYETRQDIEIRIDAFEEKTHEPVFSVSITDNTTASALSDLRRFMPLYLLNAMPYIGKNTNQRVYSKVMLSDERLQWFKE